MGQLGSGPGHQGWVTLMMPIKVPLPPLSQITGLLTQGSALPVLHPTPALIPSTPTPSWMAIRVPGPMRHEKRPQQCAPQGQKDNDLLGFMCIGLGPAQLQGRGPDVCKPSSEFYIVNPGASTPLLTPTTLPPSFLPSYP